MRAAKLTSAVGTSALLLCALASASGAQEASRRSAPYIRVYSTNGAYVLSTTSYVSPVIQVSENAYVFAVSIDLDGQIQILQPDWPGISVRILADRPLSLPNFFTGFGPSAQRGLYSASAYSAYDNYNDGFADVRGTVIALASRAPFNLDAIESNGDWNISSLRQMIEGRSPESAAQSLAYNLGVKGEPIGHDIMRFAGGRNYNNSYAYSNYYSSCDLYAAYPAIFTTRSLQANVAIARLRASGRRAAIGYDLCGLPYVIFQPSAGGGHAVRPPPRGDSVEFPKSRLPRNGNGRARRPQSASNSAPEGVFPIPQGRGLPQMGDVTITAPRGRRSEPRTILDGYRSQPGIGSVPQGRSPVERATTPRNEPAAATGAFPIRESRPESRPEPRASAPPPTRAPDPPKQSAPPPERARPTPPPAPREAPTVTNRPAPPSQQ